MILIQAAGKFQTDRKGLLMKKTLKALIITILFLMVSTVVFVHADSNISVNIDGKAVTFSDAKPYIYQGRTLIPARMVSESLGATVAWDEKSRVVTITKGTDVITLTIDQTQARKSGKIITLDVPARITNNRTYVPLRFISEALGSSVAWDDKTRTVTITTTSTVPTTTEPKPISTTTDFDALIGKHKATNAEKNLYKGTIATPSEVAPATPAMFPLKLDTTTILGVYKDEETNAIVVELRGDEETGKNGGLEYFATDALLTLKSGKTVETPGPDYLQPDSEKTFFPKWYKRFPNFASQSNQQGPVGSVWTEVYTLGHYFDTDWNLITYKPSQIEKIALWEIATENCKVIVLNMSDIPEL